MRVWSFAVPLFLSGSLAAQEPISLEKEASLGRHMAASFRRERAALESPTVKEYVERLGQKLAPHIQNARFPFAFDVIVDDRQPIHEPVSFPGGYVFVPAGLFLAAQDEAEFAGMLAHAMEHIAQRHGLAQRTPMGNVGTVPLIFLGGWAGGANVAMPAGAAAKQREAESNADELTVQAMASAGFDPAALPRYLERVQVETTLSKAFSGLPPRDERVAALRSRIAALPATDYAAPGEEFLRIQQEVRRLTEVTIRPDKPPTLRRPGEK